MRKTQSKSVRLLNKIQPEDLKYPSYLEQVEEDERYSQQRLNITWSRLKRVSGSQQRLNITWSRLKRVSGSQQRLNITAIRINRMQVLK